MSWKDEFICSFDDAIRYLERYVPLALNLPEVEVIHGPKPVAGVTTKLSIQIDRKLTPKEKETELDGGYIMHFDTWDYNDRPSLLNFVINDSFQNKGLGHLVFKAVLGVFYELSENVIVLRDVRDDGPKFWPFMGAIPLDSPLQFGDTISDNIQKYKKIASNEAETLFKIADIADREPYLAWRLLSQMPFESAITGRRFKTATFTEHCKERKNDEVVMGLLVGEPTTRAILESRLGILPPFRPVDQKNIYRSYAQELAKTRTAAIALGLQ